MEGAVGASREAGAAGAPGTYYVHVRNYGVDAGPVVDAGPTQTALRTEPRENADLVRDRHNKPVSCLEGERFHAGCVVDS